MKFLRKELKYLVFWLFAGYLVFPSLFWWLGGHGIVVLPGMDISTPEAAYRYFAWHLQEPVPVVAMAFPYLMSIAVRLLREKPPAASEPELGLAVTRGEPERVQQLIADGTDPNEGNAAGETPLQLAVMRGDMNMAWLLLESGADTNAVDPATGYTPLQIAALQGHAAICEALIRFGAGVEALTSVHETALHLAARTGHEDVTGVLLKYRANTGIRNNAGETAQQIAERRGHAGVVALMQQHASSEWPYLRLSNG
jgi:ankyrin repeat protein